MSQDQRARQKWWRRWKMVKEEEEKQQGQGKARWTAPPTVSGQGHLLRCRSIQLSLTDYSQSKHRVRSGYCCPWPRRLTANSVRGKPHTGTKFGLGECKQVKKEEEKRQQKVWVKVRRTVLTLFLRLSWNRLNSYKFMAMLVYVTRKRSVAGALTMYVVCCHDLLC
jgi:hypothetical protein